MNLTEVAKRFVIRLANWLCIVSTLWMQIQQIKYLKYKKKVSYNI